MKAASCIILAVVMGVIPLALTTRADTLAVTPNEHCTNLICHLGGVANGAVGFSFIPATNLVVMQVGFSTYGNDNPIISFFAETNLIATYFPAPNPGTNLNGQIEYSSISPLCLTQGQRYSIMLQDGVLSNSSLVVQAWANRDLAPEISNYTRQFLGREGTWTNDSSEGFVMGADFYYVVPPCNMSVAIVSSNVWLTIPTHSNELYDVQRSDVLVSESWGNIATNLSGTCDVLRHIDVGAASAASQFYRVGTHF